MDTVVATTPTETPAPPTTPDPQESTSLADHEAQFGPGKDRTPAKEPIAATSAPTNGEVTETPTEAERARDDKGQFTKADTERRRSARQDATPADSPRIAELTRKWREAERRAEEAERRASVSSPTREPAAAPSAPFSEKEPKIEDFASDPDPYTAYTKALVAHGLKQELHAAQQVFTQRQHAEAQQVAAAEGEKIASQVEANIAAFKAHTPDYDERVNAVDDIRYPNILGHVIVTSDNPAQLVYYFATNVDDYVDTIGFASSLNFDEPSVALLRRRVNRYMRATDAPPSNGATGASKPAAKVIVAPKPPTPVGTGPLKTGDEPPGDNDMSLANHEKFFGRKRR